MNTRDNKKSIYYKEILSVNIFPNVLCDVIESYINDFFKYIYFRNEEKNKVFIFDKKGTNIYFGNLYQIYNFVDSTCRPSYFSYSSHQKYSEYIFTTDFENELLVTSGESVMINLKDYGIFEYDFLKIMQNFNNRSGLLYFNYNNDKFFINNGSENIIYNIFDKKITSLEIPKRGYDNSRIHFLNKSIIYAGVHRLSIYNENNEHVRSINLEELRGTGVKSHTRRKINRADLQICGDKIYILYHAVLYILNKDGILLQKTDIMKKANAHKINWGVQLSCNETLILFSLGEKKIIITKEICENGNIIFVSAGEGFDKRTRKIGYNTP